MKRYALFMLAACAVAPEALHAQERIETLEPAIRGPAIEGPTVSGPDRSVVIPWSTALAATRAREMTTESVAAFFDAAFNVQRLDHPMVGAVVSVVYDGEVLLERGYGWADLEGRVPADPGRSLFRIASITKPFVWTAIMQLVEEGRLDLHDDVERYLDFEIPDTYDEPIRVWHLLTHTPGFEERALGGLARTADDVGPLGPALAELMPARVRPPGEHASYSNYGAALAGYIVERVSGRPWAEYVEERIFRPLGMTSSNARAVMAPELKARHARGYTFTAGAFLPTPFWHVRLGPAGVMSSTASDMANFMLAHLNGGTLGDARILQERTTRQMQSPLFAPHAELLPILHGFYRSDRNGRVVFGHGGDVNQFHSNMSLLPAVGLGIFVSYNSDPAAAARSNVIPAFLDHFFPAAESRVVASVEPAPEVGSAAHAPVDIDLSDYAGAYIPLRNNFSTFESLRTISNSLSLGVDGADLRVGGGGKLVAKAPDLFTGEQGGPAIVFERNERGDVTHMLAGTPLATFQRVRGLRQPTVVRPLLNLALLISLAAVLGWGYRVVRRVPDDERLPAHHVGLGWVHAALVGGLLYALLAGNFGIHYGMPTILRTLLVAYSANLVLAPIVIAFACRQWSSGCGTVWSRMRYSLVALMALWNVWFAWTFNLLLMPM